MQTQENFEKQTLARDFLVNKMVREPNVSPHKQIIKDDDVEESTSTE